MRAALFALAALSLAGCASLRLSQDAEKADVTALQLYAMIGHNLDLYETAKCGSNVCNPSAEALRTKAWNATVAANLAYKSGLIADLSTLESLVTQSKAPS